MNVGEAWIQEYKNKRYLKHLSDEGLFERYNYLYDIQLTINKFGENDFRDIRPKFWHSVMRRFYDVITELKIRNLTFSDMPMSRVIPPMSRVKDSNLFLKIHEKIRQRKPDLVKFSSCRYLEKFSFKVSLASTFKSDELNLARRDDELNLDFNIGSSDYTLTDINGGTIEADSMNIIFNLFDDYYIFCTSNVFDFRLFESFSADSCLLIYDFERFTNDIYREINEQVLMEDYGYSPIDYVDPVIPAMEGNEPVIETSKHIAYSYQHEFRHFFYPVKTSEMRDHLYINLKDAGDYCELVTLF
ncbi:MAG: hypothetical protein JXR16_11295 [Bermanella sp.]